MSDRLVVHAHVPKSGSGLLNRNVFFRSFTRGETMLAYGEDHGRLARVPGADRRAVAARLGRASLAIGHVPYGYFDGFGRWTVYISVFDDPVRRFLNFAGAVMTERAATAASLFGGAARPADPERTVDGLLDLDDVQTRQTDMMTRIAAGLPAFGAARPRREHLNVARANVVRSNYIVATRAQMPAFEGYLAQVLGVSTEGRGGGGWATPAARKDGAVTIRRADLSARTLKRIEAANDLDMRLYDAVMEQNAACWA